MVKRLSGGQLRRVGLATADVRVLTDGRISFTGTTGDFLAHAPAGTPDARRAEAAYTAVGARSAASSHAS
ncbi:hypothetical protein [Streptomyces sp. Rer75]|uniref:hypothetical protein n=1 Tax=unclassified Streptomyces TaxID=2593676 RepID=UPI0015D0B4DC|nr:hypothetical protein [Streptomyces sp. Rer75]QLH23931.1 hypothetical protein HYQ63_27640 [Streptomyces sp. Rer75]